MILFEYRINDCGNDHQHAGDREPGTRLKSNENEAGHKSEPKIDIHRNEIAPRGRRQRLKELAIARVAPRSPEKQLADNGHQNCQNAKRQNPVAESFRRIEFDCRKLHETYKYGQRRVCQRRNPNKRTAGRCSAARFPILLIRSSPIP